MTTTAVAIAKARSHSMDAISLFAERQAPSIHQQIAGCLREVNKWLEAADGGASHKKAPAVRPTQREQGKRNLSNRTTGRKAA